MRIRSASVLSDSVLYLYALLPALLILRQQDLFRQQPTSPKLSRDDANSVYDVQPCSIASQSELEPEKCSQSVSCTVQSMWKGLPQVNSSKRVPCIVG